jgi:WD40 repeat protein
VKRLTDIIALLMLLALAEGPCVADEPKKVIEQPKPRTLFKGRDRISNLAFSPDGKILASGQCNGNPADKNWGEVKVWNVTTGKEIITLKRHDDSLAFLGFTVDGKTLASADVRADLKGTLRLWDPVNGKLQAEISDKSICALSPDGKTCVLHEWGNFILWNMATKKERATLKLESHGFRFGCVQFSPDGKTVATGVYEGSVTLWDASTGKEIAKCNSSKGEVATMAFSADSKTLAWATEGGTIKLWNLSAGKEPSSLHQAGVCSLAVTPDGKTLVTGSGAPGIKGEVKLWDVHTGSELASLPVGKHWVVDLVSIAPDGKTLAVASGGYQSAEIQLWDLPFPESGKK